MDGYAHVLIGVERPRYAVMRLQEARDNTKDEKIRAQFDKVIDRIKTIEAGFAP